MAISHDLSLYDLLYEEDLLRNPFTLKPWCRYLTASSNSPFTKRSLIYERALNALPRSYKLWHAYLHEHLDRVRNLPITHPHYDTLNKTFERALVTMHKMPKIWIMYLQTLTHQKLITRTRRAFDRALRALPITQHGRIWEPYIEFVTQKGIPIETSVGVYRRYLKFDPSCVEDFIEFCVNSSLWQEAAEMLLGFLLTNDNDNDDEHFYYCSVKGKKTKNMLWLQLCGLLLNIQDASEVLPGLNVDAVIRAGTSKFAADEVGRLWTSLAEYYIRRGLQEKARDVLEEGMSNVITVKDFGVIFDSYCQFEESMVAHKMEEIVDFTDDEEVEEEEENRFKDFGKKFLKGFWLNDQNDIDLRLTRLEHLMERRPDEEVEEEEENRFKDFGKKFLKGFWLNDQNDIDLRLTRLEHLMERRPELANSVLLRQNPHNVEQWHRRVKLFDGNPTRQILTYRDAVRTIDPMKAVGKPHTLWIAFAKLYEHHNDLANARVIFDKAVQVNYKTVDNLASVWCEWAEMELRHHNFKGALELMGWAIAEPSVEVKRKVAADGNEPVQMKLHKSLRLWTFYVDLEESLGTLQSTRAIYERMLDLRIATPQIIINYACFLEENKYFEEMFQVYERGVKVFQYPHVKDIWVTYLSKFVKRYGNTNLERARDLFKNAIERAPADQVKPIFLQYAKLEEDYGLAKEALKVYAQATKAVPKNEMLSMYKIYIARAAEILGVPGTREIYEQAIESGLPEKDVKTMCLKYAELEKSLREIDRAREIYVFASKFADPRSDPEFWNMWHEFEVQHGNKDTYREMLHIKRSVYSQTHFILPEYPMQKDQTVNLDEAKDKLKEAGFHEDEIAALEMQLAPAGYITVTKERKVGFVSARLESQSDGAIKTSANHEDIELPDESVSDDDDKTEIAQKDVPSVVFGGLIRKREDNENNGEADAANKNQLGALGRIKRMK